MYVTHDRRVTTLLAIACSAESSAWLGWAVSYSDTSRGEARNVVTVLVQGCGFADAHFSGTGPTIYLSPTMPFLSDSFHIAFAVKNPLSEPLLQVTAVISPGPAYSLAVLMFVTWRIFKPARIPVIIFLCAMPLLLGKGAWDFRYWNGGLACAAWLMAHNQAVISAVEWPPLSIKIILTITAIFAVWFAADSTLWLVLMLRYPLNTHAFLPFSAVSDTAVFPYVWAIRNCGVFQKLTALCSILRIELSGANNAMGVRSDTKEAIYRSRAQWYPTSARDPARLFDEPAR